MKTYYCVCTSYDDWGRVVSNIVDTVEAPQQTREHVQEHQEERYLPGLVRHPERRQGPCGGGTAGIVKKTKKAPASLRKPGPFPPARMARYLFAFFRIPAVITATSWRVIRLCGRKLPLESRVITPAASTCSICFSAQGAMGFLACSWL